jgi:DNA-binding NarL/FixJ family response regulator
MEKIRVLVADDHRLFRTGLATALAPFKEIEICGEAHNGDITLEQIKALKPDMVLLDLKMPLLSGIEVLNRLATEGNKVKCLIISGFVDEWDMQVGFDNGALGCLSKDAKPAELLAAIKSVHENGYYFDENVRVSFLKEILRRHKFGHTGNEKMLFDEREKKIMNLICREYSNAQIAGELFLSERTIEGIRTKMLHKVGAKNVVGLIIYAFRTGMVNLEV